MACPTLGSFPLAGWCGKCPVSDTPPHGVEFTGYNHPGQSQLSPFPYKSMLPLSLDLCVCMCVKSLQSCPTLCDPMDHQAPLSMEFSRQDYWNGLPFLSPVDVLHPRIKFQVSTLWADSLLSQSPRNPIFTLSPGNYSIQILTPSDTLFHYKNKMKGYFFSDSRTNFHVKVYCISNFIPF